MQALAIVDLCVERASVLHKAVGFGFGFDFGGFLIAIGELVGWLIPRGSVDCCESSEVRVGELVDWFFGLSARVV